MTVYVMRDGVLIERDLAPARPTNGTAPYVISDEMPETRHMATNRYFTSKAAFRAETKAAGCIEVGNDPAALRPRKPITLNRMQRREDIKRAIYDLRNGRR